MWLYYSDICMWCMRHEYFCTIIPVEEIRPAIELLTNTKVALMNSFVSRIPLELSTVYRAAYWVIKLFGFLENITLLPGKIWNFQCSSIFVLCFINCRMNQESHSDDFSLFLFRVTVSENDPSHGHGPGCFQEFIYWIRFFR